jgi:hypothetical protein
LHHVNSVPVIRRRAGRGPVTHHQPHRHGQHLKRAMTTVPRDWARSLQMCNKSGSRLVWSVVGLQAIDADSGS